MSEPEGITCEAATGSSSSMGKGSMVMLARRKDLFKEQNHDTLMLLLAHVLSTSPSTSSIPLLFPLFCRTMMIFFQRSCLKGYPQSGVLNIKFSSCRVHNCPTNRPIEVTLRTLRSLRDKLRNSSTKDISRRV